ncbi:hypothetical protein AB9U01_06185 [Pseudomonas qingdaonensis]|uniref:hypothetical protein n=1 Tax=Pseudomonas qingdaonensis TaxID=2056231 RepID=UPI003515363A
MSYCINLTEADWSLTKDLFSIISTFVSAAAVAVAFYFGREGLNTWRRQLRGTADHELARRLLIELHHYKDAIHAARDIAFLSEEFAPDESDQDVGGESFEEQRYRNMSRAYRRRFRVIHSCSAPMRASLLEADLMWSEQTSEDFKSVLDLERELWIAVRRYLESINPSNPPDVRQRYYARWAADKKIVQDLYDGDEYRNMLEDKVKQVESVVKRKLL